MASTSLRVQSSDTCFHARRDDERIPQRRSACEMELLRASQIAFVDTNNLLRSFGNVRNCGGATIRRVQAGSDRSSTACLTRNTRNPSSHRIGDHVDDDAAARSTKPIGYPSRTSLLMNLLVKHDRCMRAPGTRNSHMWSESEKARVNHRLQMTSCDAPIPPTSYNIASDTRPRLRLFSSAREL
jgi:hypothetical protein